MAKNYIIDGFNLGYKIPSVATVLRAGDVENAIHRIIQFVSRNVPLNAESVIIVFDGQRGVFSNITTSARIKIRFSRAPQKADDVIRSFLRNLSAAQNWTVVTSDREILNTARDMGAHVQRSENLAQKKSASNSTTTFEDTREKYAPDNVDVEFWLKQFGSEDNE